MKRIKLRFSCFGRGPGDYLLARDKRKCVDTFDDYEVLFRVPRRLKDQLPEWAEIVTEIGDKLLCHRRGPKYPVCDNDGILLPQYWALKRFNGNAVR